MGPPWGSLGARSTYDLLPINPSHGTLGGWPKGTYHHTTFHEHGTFGWHGNHSPRPIQLTRAAHPADEGSPPPPEQGGCHGPPRGSLGARSTYDLLPINLVYSTPGGTFGCHGDHSPKAHGPPFAGGGMHSREASPGEVICPLPVSLG